MNHRRCKQTSHAKSRYGNWPTSGTEKQTNKRHKRHKRHNKKRTDQRWGASVRNEISCFVSEFRSESHRNGSFQLLLPSNTVPANAHLDKTIHNNRPAPPTATPIPRQRLRSQLDRKKPNKPSPRLRRSTRTSHAEQTKQVGRRRSLLIESETVVTPRCDEASVRN